MRALLSFAVLSVLCLLTACGGAGGSQSSATQAPPAPGSTAPASLLFAVQYPPAASPGTNPAADLTTARSFLVDAVTGALTETSSFHLLGLNGPDVVLPKANLVVFTSVNEVTSGASTCTEPTQYGENCMYVMKYDPGTGAFSPLAPPMPLPAAPYNMAFTPDMHTLYIRMLSSPNSAPTAQDPIAAYAFEPSTGQLTLKSSSVVADTGGYNLAKFVIDPSGQYAIAVGYPNPWTSASLLTYALDPNTPAWKLVSTTSISPWQGVADMKFTPDGSMLLVSAWWNPPIVHLSDAVVPFTFTNGEFQQLGTSIYDTTFGGNASLAMGSHGQLAYGIGLAYGRAIYSMSITAAGLQSIQNAIIPDTQSFVWPWAGVAVGNGGSVLYVAAQGGITAYAIDPISGALSPLNDGNVLVSIARPSDLLAVR